MNDDIFATTITITINVENCDADGYGDYLARYIDQVLKAAKVSSAGVEVKNTKVSTSSVFLEEA